MMKTSDKWGSSKAFFLGVGVAVLLSACSTNPATGDRQFTALMSPAQENQLGATEHEKVIKLFGDENIAPALKLYVQEIGTRVSQDTERPDVSYKFTVLDTPMINAFAVPGGYIYVSRGLMALANSEAELAAVLAHETGHITARHSAERYSRGVLTSLGAMALSVALDSPAASDMIGLGSDLYIKSYSRGQENQADELGVRYLEHGGYDPFAMAQFLGHLEANEALERKLAGQGEEVGFNYFSTHPLTAERVVHAGDLAASYPVGKDDVGRERYLDKIDGMIYGDSPKQGYVRGRDFYHLPMDFTFRVPPAFEIVNQPTRIVAADKQSGAVILFDAATAQGANDPLAYLTQLWMKDAALQKAERIDINGKPAATASFSGTVNGKPSDIRLVAIQWAPGKFFRFQIAIPQGAPAALVEELRRTTYSLRPLNAQEKRDIQPHRIRIITAKAGDSVASLARRMPFDTLQEERFRVLNGMTSGEQLVAGRRYKIISDR